MLTRSITVATLLLLAGLPAAAQYHTADTVHDQLISLSEVLRIVQFFNSDGFHCEAGTEDGYAPGPGDQACAPHDSDFSPQDWYINLTELLRLVQLYNAGGYHTECSTEDNCAPGPGSLFDCGPEDEAEMILVPAGTFTMGNSGFGDDGTYGYSCELPRHQVTLSAYQIGKYEVTNQEYANILNWALAKGYLYNSSGAAYSGGEVYAASEPLLSVPYANCQVTYLDGTFGVKTEAGLPGATNYSMALHPVVVVTWYGAAMYCNWLSEKKGLTPCYDTSTWACNSAANGYHLPTEAQWERAAAWDGAKHWIYGFMSDTLTGKDQCNYNAGTFARPDYVNPLGLAANLLHTSPVGWFNGANVSPNGNVQTMDSPSPVGCYDMCGNVLEWCQDLYDSAYYQTCADQGIVTDPTGPATGSYRANRGGDWRTEFSNCRSALRAHGTPTFRDYFVGFRIVK